MGDFYSSQSEFNRKTIFKEKVVLKMCFILHFTSTYLLHIYILLLHIATETGFDPFILMQVIWHLV